MINKLMKILKIFKKIFKNYIRNKNKYFKVILKIIIIN